MALTRHGKTRLLDDADQNIGNSQQVDCSNSIIVEPISNPPRIINLDAKSDTGQTACVAIAAQTIPQAQGTVASFAGPLTAILEFGNGSVSQKVEIDVPIGRVQDFRSPASIKQGQVIASVPAGTLRVYGRNDGNLITPSQNQLIGFPPGSVQFGLAILGNIPRNFGSWTPTTPNIYGPPSAVIQAAATYFALGGPTTGPRNTKTIWVWNGIGIQVRVNLGILGFFPALYWIPALAKSVKLIRLPTTDAFTVDIVDQAGNMESYTVAGGATDTFHPLPGGALMIGLTSNGANTTSCALVFEIDI